TLPPPLVESPDILLPREQELEEADAAVLAGLLDAQQHEVVRQPLLAHLAVVKLAKACERLDRVLCYVVVPGDVVVVQEGEEPALVLEEPLLVPLRQLGAVDAGGQLAEEEG